jgi:nitroimidazol reductase NimA-like FMN-containing flavoprotein (pyridoxamine 5'-phosphate oxidase superfamily)
MRRADKTITDTVLIAEILQKATICRIAMVDDGKPYIVPMNFGYADNNIYLHSALAGRKIEILKQNNHVCFEVEIDCELVQSDTACNFGMRYKSVIGFGQAVFLEDLTQKRHAFEIIMQKYSSQKFLIPDVALNQVAVIKISISELAGKQSGKAT